MTQKREKRNTTRELLEAQSTFSKVWQTLLPNSKQACENADSKSDHLHATTRNNRKKPYSGHRTKK